MSLLRDFNLCRKTVHVKSFDNSLNLKAQHGGLKGNLFVSTERHDALYVVGALEEAMELRGMRYHPIDIETSVIRTHKSITEW